MVRKGKWITDASPSEPLEQVAARALDARLNLVWHYLPRAANEPEKIENVHQLRVSTRRAMAAMQFFDALLTPRRALWMNKQLKRLRQAAGDARDLDVLAQRLNERNAAAGGDPYQAVLKRVSRMRKAAQQPIETIWDRLQHKDLAERHDAFIARVRLRGKADRLLRPSFDQAARRSLGLLVEDFFTAASADFSDYAALHAFRIQGKQLRYAMEIFAAALDRALRDEIYPIVEALQEKLGRINDHVTAKELFAGWLADTQTEGGIEILPALIAEEVEALAIDRQEFFEWWTADRAQDLHRRFHEVLDSPGHEKTA